MLQQNRLPIWKVALSLAALVVGTAARVPAQEPPPLPVPAAPYERPDTPPVPTPAELDRLVSPIALYPDPLLANVLTAATFPDDIPGAAKWADDHHHLSGSRLTAAMAADAVPWDPSVQALLPFPSVLGMMAGDMPWTEALGDAVLSDRKAVMDAVQRMRRIANDYGYLRGCRDVAVHTGPWIDIMPLRSDFIVVPYYFPKYVFQPPVPGVLYGGVYCGYGVQLGVWFGPWGWGATRILWPEGTIILDGMPWERTWVNQRVYRHPYRSPRFSAPPPPERHREQPRTPRERERERPRGAPPQGPPSQGSQPQPQDGNPPRGRAPKGGATPSGPQDGGDKATPAPGRPPGKRK